MQQQGLALGDADFQLLAKLLLKIKGCTLSDDIALADAIMYERDNNIGNQQYLEAVHNCLKFRYLYQQKVSRQRIDMSAAIGQIVSTIIRGIRLPAQRKRLYEDVEYLVSSEHNQLGMSGESPGQYPQSSHIPNSQVAYHNDQAPTKKVKFKLDAMEELIPVVELSEAMGNSPGCIRYPPADKNDFKIAIICALPLEADAVLSLFDVHWDIDGRYGSGLNAYSIGMIGRHNVVLVHMPEMGKVSAASAIATCQYKFAGIKLGLVVGICGAVPFGKSREDILLGDVVISRGIIQYDFGKQYPNGFVRKGNQDILCGHKDIQTFLARLETQRSRKRLQKRSSEYLSVLHEKLGEAASYPGADKDWLFKSDYHHKHQTPSGRLKCAACKKTNDLVCETAITSSCDELGCDKTKLVSRRRLDKAADTAANGQDDIHSPVIHFGLFASGDTVMKSSEVRDNIAAKENVIAFEMEGAGASANFPCLVIKGACDYADSHKSKKWQNYAAATAAACMKALLEDWYS
ncbi:hypothetical protein ABW19_dt0207112 [Dactylella cylindrospora]|nr:hypothetical protein ABW19_dt0207112 [Dactylella cylindrospora]